MIAASNLEATLIRSQLDLSLDNEQEGVQREVGDDMLNSAIRLLMIFSVTKKHLQPLKLITFGTLLPFPSFEQIMPQLL